MCACFSVHCFVYSHSPSALFLKGGARGLYSVARAQEFKTFNPYLIKSDLDFGEFKTKKQDWDHFDIRSDQEIQSKL